MRRERDGMRESERGERRVEEEEEERKGRRVKKGGER